MSIQDAAYRLCKDVVRSPGRGAIRDVLFAVNHVTEAMIGTPSDRGTFGRMSRDLNAQFAGYLVVQRDWCRMAKDLPALGATDGLTQSERDLLFAAHQQLVALGRECTRPLVERLPYISSAIDPYARFGDLSGAHDCALELYSMEAAMTVAKSFHSHPLGKVVMALGAALEKAPDLEKLRDSVVALDSLLVKDGPLRYPQQLRGMLPTYGPSSPAQAVACAAAAIACLRATLGVIFQLAYQAVLLDRLPVLNLDNVVHIGALNSHFAGTGLTLLCQDGDRVPAEIGLVLVDLGEALPPDAIPKLWRVESLTVRLSQELGDTVEYQLRSVDENLNPYGRLLVPETAAWPPPHSISIGRVRT